MREGKRPKEKYSHFLALTRAYPIHSQIYRARLYNFPHVFSVHTYTLLNTLARTLTDTLVCILGGVRDQCSALSKMWKSSPHRDPFLQPAFTIFFQSFGLIFFFCFKSYLWTAMLFTGRESNIYEIYQYLSNLRKIYCSQAIPSISFECLASSMEFIVVIICLFHSYDYYYYSF